MRIKLGAAGACGLPLALWLAAGSTTALAQPMAAGICPAHVEHAAEVRTARVIRITLYNRSRMKPVDIDGMFAAANRIWAPYGVTMELGAGPAPGAVAVVLSYRNSRTADEYGPLVLGTTLFDNGHATPYITLSLAAAENFAENSSEGGVRFTARTTYQRDAILMRMVGVALAHEMAHYLLDTSTHSTEGLLQAGLTIRELSSPDSAHLTLTPHQLRLLYCDDRP